MPSGLDRQKSESHPMVQTGIPFRVRSKLAMSFIVFGLLATLILAISVAANYWLYTSEPIDISEQVIANLKASGKFDEDAGPPPPGAYVSVINTFSGLWKVCVSSEADKGRCNYLLKLVNYHTWVYFIYTYIGTLNSSVVSWVWR